MTATVILGLLLLGSLAGAWYLQRARATLLHLAGFVFLYVGQRLYAGDDLSTPISLAGLVLLLAGLGARAQAASAAGDPSVAAGQRAALRWQAVGVASLLLYALTLDATLAALGLGEEAVSRWSVSFTALWPIVALIGTWPALLLDRAIADHPRRLPEGARKHAVVAGVGLALATSLAAPVNYLAAEHDMEWDFSYFRVTRPGSSTSALVSNLDTPVEIILFYAANSEVKEKMLPYFDELARGSNGKLSVRVTDQPMEPKLSEELAVRDNGYVVVTQARPGQDKPAVEKFKVDPDIKKARKDLRKLDETFQKALLKLAKGKRVAYVMTGHGEASAREDNPIYKLGVFKEILRAQNYDVKDFGLDQGSSSDVPEDAALLVLAGPQKALLPEEIGAFKRFNDKGGATLIYLDPGRDPLAEVLGHLGLKAGASPLANQAKNVPVSGGQVDRYNLFSQRFGTHPSVATLSKYATKAAVVFLGAVGIEETGAATAPTPIKATPLIRSFDDTWADTNANATKDADEPTKAQVLAMAVQGPETAAYRAVVIGDVSSASDFVAQRSQGNTQLILDSVRWLVGDEALAGETQSEEDVKIEHTSEQDKIWFYGTIFGVPLSVLGLGAALVNLRSRKKA
jgi:hypothetical protein